MANSNTDNLNLNLNPARSDKFSLILGDIPSLPLLSPADLNSFQKTQQAIDEKNYFHLSLKSAEIPGVSIGNESVNTMFSPIAETDMKYTFSPLTTEVRIDNNFLIYKMLILWLFLIKRPDEYNQFEMGITHEKTAITAILSLQDNFDNPVITFEFFDLRPIALPSIPMTYNNEGEEINISVTWQYTYFMPRTINGDSYNLNLPV